MYIAALKTNQYYKMKKITTLLIIAFVAFSCSKEEKKADYVLFSGRITNPNSSKVRISGDDFKKSIKMKDGVFSDTLFIKKDGFYTFSDGQENTAMYLKKGSTVAISLDTKEFDETVAYTGSNESDFLAKKYMLLEKSGLDGRELIKKSAETLKSETDLLKNKITDLLSKYKVSPAFKKDMEKDIAYLAPATTAKFLAYQGYFFGNKIEGAEALEKELDGINYDDEAAFKTLDNYKMLVDIDFMRKAAKAEDKGIAYIKSKKSKLIKNHFIKQIAREISPRNKNIDKDYKAILALSTDEDFKKELTAKYEKFKELTPGKPSPSFENFENYKGGTTSLADLKGKYVYIDVWATWCSPCKREIPFLQKIEEEYHNKNIAFVSLSIDTKEAHQAWKDMVAEKNMGGIQLYAPNDWKTKFVQDYGIEGIPTFILIDPEGNIVSASAPRPSSPQLKVLLDSLLKK